MKSCLKIAQAKKKTLADSAQVLALQESGSAEELVCAGEAGS